MKRTAIKVSSGPFKTISTIPMSSVQLIGSHWKADTYIFMMLVYAA